VSTDQESQKSLKENNSTRSISLQLKKKKKGTLNRFVSKGSERAVWLLSLSLSSGLTPNLRLAPENDSFPKPTGYLPLQKLPQKKDTQCRGSGHAGNTVATTKGKENIRAFQGWGCGVQSPGRACIVSIPNYLLTIFI